MKTFYATAVEALSVTEQKLRMQSHIDPVLSRALELVQLGWQEKYVHTELFPYAHRGNEIIIHHGVLMWDSRVVVSATLRDHEDYTGMVKKSLSLGFVWWPNIDKDIERALRNGWGC